VRRILWLVVILLLVAVLFTAGCAGHPRGMKSLRWLTNAEKEKVIEIALGTPEAMQAKEEHGIYQVNLSWVDINWIFSHASELYGLDYEMVDKIPDKIPESAEFYSPVELYFGDPPRVLWRIAVNPDTGEVVHVEWHGLKIVPSVNHSPSPTS